MKLHTLFISALLALCGCASSGSVFVAPSSEAITYMGRIDRSDSSAYKFTYPGTTAMLAFEGTGIDMITSPGSGYYMVAIDSLPAQKIFIGPGDSTVSLADSLAEGAHKVRVTYCVEGYEFHPEWRGFNLAPGSRLLDAPVCAGPKIEFIGNSITCGYGVDADSPEQHFDYATENHCLSYAHLAARILDADYNVVARSGIGMYRNYGGPRDGSPSETMPLEYDKTRIYEPGLWDHSQFHPDIICINLGTNDTSKDDYDIALYEQAYSQFLNHLHTLHPDAKIVLLTGSMLHGQALADVQGALDRLAADRPYAYRFDMSEEDGSLGYGADYHPSSGRAMLNAVQLSLFLNSLL